MIKKNLIIILVLCIFVVILGGCLKKNEPISNESTAIVISGDKKEEPLETIQVYGNGTGVVNYKDEIYFIEYGDQDFGTEGIIYPEYGLNIYANSQRYLNKIDTKGNIRNLFKVTSSTNFYIMDDRFYLSNNNGQLYTVNMQGENTVELAKGYYVAFDYPAHAVYYQNEDNPNVLYRIDTQTLSIKMFDFDNPTTTNNYNLLTARNGILYYTLLDTKEDKLVLVEHNVESNERKELAEKELYRVEENYEDDMEYAVICTDAIDKYAVVCAGLPCTGSMGGYYNGEVYSIDLEENKIDVAIPFESSEGGNFSYEFFCDKLEQALYILTYKKDLPKIQSLLTDKEKNDFAERYGIDLSAKIGEEAEGASATSPDTEKYIIEVEQHFVVGDKILYKITASRRNPRADIGWRPVYLRIATEVYIKDLKSNDVQFIYSYVNGNYEEQVKEILDDMEADTSKISGEAIETINANAEETTKKEETLKDGEMYVDIKFDNIWKSEFDVRVEEVGGIIFGKRIEYEGHHKKEEGSIKLKVNKEVGAMLSVYIDDSLNSQFVISEDM